MPVPGELLQERELVVCVLAGELNALLVTEYAELQTSGCRYDLRSYCHGERGRIKNEVLRKSCYALWGQLHFRIGPPTSKQPPTNASKVTLCTAGAEYKCDV
jgi:hypothetical protein